MDIWVVTSMPTDDVNDAKTFSTYKAAENYVKGLITDYILDCLKDGEKDYALDFIKRLQVEYYQGGPEKDHISGYIVNEGNNSCSYVDIIETVLDKPEI